MADLVAGAFVTPSLRLVAPLGEGAMGCVWIADHLALKSRVAVKLLSRTLAGDPECVERFAREAEAAAQVRSPHVVQVFDHGVGEQGLPYIVMELLEGCDLGARLRRERPLSIDVVVPIVAQACKALARAHARGLVHRDVKPENIFLCDDGGAVPFVKLLDFGIAKLKEHAVHLTQSGSWIGSPSYMSPEQSTGDEDLDARSDLWSLGVVTYEALTGVRPFQGASVREVIANVRSARHVPPSQVRPELPRAIDAWFAKACARDRSARFSSAIEMAEAFERAARGTIAEVTPPPARRSRRRAPAIAAAFVGVAAATTFALRGGASIDAPRSASSRTTSVATTGTAMVPLPSSTSVAPSAVPARIEAQPHVVDASPPKKRRAVHAKATTTVAPPLSPLPEPVGDLPAPVPTDDVDVEGAPSEPRTDEDSI